MQASPTGQMNKQEFINSLWVIAHTAIATAIIAAAQQYAGVNFGPYTSVVVIALAFLSALAQKWLSGPVCTVPSHQALSIPQINVPSVFSTNMQNLPNATVTTASTTTPPSTPIPPSPVV